MKSSRTSVLVDAGISGRRLTKELGDINESVPSTVFVTHLHSDHISGMDSRLFSGAEVYCGENCVAPLGAKLKKPDGVRLHPVVSGRDFFVGDITVCPVSVSHDVPCISYSFISEGRKLAILTDLGYVTDGLIESVSDSDLVIIESNYDDGLLARNPSYPEELKRRIAGRKGHLSNDQCAEAVARLASAGIRKFMLAHLSEKNNSPDAAGACTRAALERAGLSGGVSLFIASQGNRSGFIEV